VAPVPVAASPDQLVVTFPWLSYALVVQSLSALVEDDGRYWSPDTLDPAGSGPFAVWAPTLYVSSAMAAVCPLADGDAWEVSWLLLAS
jgi:hypothetical protein